VGLANDNQADLLLWMNETCLFSTGDPELIAPSVGTLTPLAGSLAVASSYFATVMSSDLWLGNRSYVVVLLTDGYDTCGGDPEAAATALLNSGVITWVIGLGVSAPDATLDAIAAAGGSGTSAIYPTDAYQITNAVKGIVDSF
jgi:hypothetical protein